MIVIPLYNALHGLLLHPATKALIWKSKRSLNSMGRIMTNALFVCRGTIDKAIEFCDKGTALQGKYAARLIAGSRNAENIKKAVDTIIDILSDAERDSNLLGPLTAVTELFKRDVKEVGARSDEIIEKVNAKVLSVILPQPVRDVSNAVRFLAYNLSLLQENVEIWQELDQMDDDSQAKVYALKLLVQRCAWGLPAKADTGERVKQLFKAFHYILLNDGQVTATSAEAYVLSLRPMMRSSDQIRYEQWRIGSTPEISGSIRSDEIGSFY